MNYTEDSTCITVSDRAANQTENDAVRQALRGHKGIQRVVDVIANLGGHGDSDQIRKIIPSVSISTILVGLRMATQHGYLVENKDEQDRRRVEANLSVGGRPRKVYFLASALRRDGEPASPRLSMFVEAALKNRTELDRAWMSVAACARAQLDEELTASAETTTETTTDVVNDVATEAPKVPSIQTHRAAKSGLTHRFEVRATT